MMIFLKIMKKRTILREYPKISVILDKERKNGK